MFQHKNQEIILTIKENVIARKRYHKLVGTQLCRHLGLTPSDQRTVVKPYVPTHLTALPPRQYFRPKESRIHQGLRHKHTTQVRKLVQCVQSHHVSSHTKILRSPYTDSSVSHPSKFPQQPPGRYIHAPVSPARQNLGCSPCSIPGGRLILVQFCTAKTY